MLLGTAVRPCQRGCLTSHACVMWGPRTLNADDDDDDELDRRQNSTIEPDKSGSTLGPDQSDFL